MASPSRLTSRSLVPAFAAFAVVACFEGRASARDVDVATADALAAAITAAAPGDVIILAAGTYKSTGFSCRASGTEAAPIVVRSATPLAAKVQLDALEGFHVTGAYWHFEGLDITGVCADDSSCEHAFHVTGAADGFVMRGNRIFDFNAQLKVNADKDAGGVFRQSTGGLVEGNEIGDSHARATSNPVTKLNIDTGIGWVVRANYIHDAHKNGGDGVSYASFMKSGGRDGVYERNLVICSKDDATGGTRIGLSFGGGGTAPQYCAPSYDAAVPCAIEHSSGTMRNNVIVNCSDVGIYLNRSKGTKLLYNTLIATNGIDFRFDTTSGEADGNVLASKIRTRDGGAFTAGLNLEGVPDTDFAAWYVAPLSGDLRKRGDLASLLQKGAARAEVVDDYCARKRSDARLDLGALESTLGDCDTTRPPWGGAVSPGDAGSGDGGGTDTGIAPGGDAGTSDAGDAASPDAANDGGTSVGAESPDASDAAAASSGCGCRAAPRGEASGAATLYAIVAAIVTLGRRRR